MITVQGDMQLADNTANAWFALRAAALAEFRVALRISSPAGAWRSPEMVMDMWLYPAKYGATKGTAKPRALGGPGSVHESGRCVDIYNWPAMGPTESKAITNLEKLAARFGFTRTIKVEAWHYQHDGVTAGGGSGGAATIQGEDDVMNIVPATDGFWYCVGQVGMEKIGTAAELTSLQATENNLVKRITDPQSGIADLQLWTAYSKRVNTPEGLSGDFDTSALVAEIEAAIAEATAAVNANIDDQPTEFEITPKP